jgi:hypothetical protein
MKKSVVIQKQRGNLKSWGPVGGFKQSLGHNLEGSSILSLLFSLHELSSLFYHILPTTRFCHIAGSKTIVSTNHGLKSLKL